jgi:hypothetical protein
MPRTRCRKMAPQNGAARTAAVRAPEEARGWRAWAVRGTAVAAAGVYVWAAAVQHVTFGGRQGTAVRFHDGCAAAVP